MNLIRWPLVSLALTLSASCTSLAPGRLEAPVRIERLPYPSMSPKQVVVYTACRLALGGNDRRRAAKGEAVVAEARETCINKFWILDDWWAVFVKLWSVAEPAESKSDS